MVTGTQDGGNRQVQSRLAAGRHHGAHTMIKRRYCSSNTALVGLERRE